MIALLDQLLNVFKCFSVYDKISKHEMNIFSMIKGIYKNLRAILNANY